jgi:hypothetical protein
MPEHEADLVRAQPRQVPITASMCTSPGGNPVNTSVDGRYQTLCPHHAER